MTDGRLPTPGSRLNVFTLADYFGGRVALLARLNAAGHVDLTRAALNKWFDRRTIPRRWLSAIAELAEDDGTPINWSRFIMDSGTP